LLLSVPDIRPLTPAEQLVALHAYVDTDTIPRNSVCARPLKCQVNCTILMLVV